MTPPRIQAATNLTPPPVARMDGTSEVLHGIRVADPYRWLEDADSTETREWVVAQNRRTEAYLRGCEALPALEKRLRQVWNYARIGEPRREAGWIYYTRNSGLQNQAPLVRIRKPGDPESLVLDPNRLSKDGTVALTDYAVSRDGRYLAWMTATSGSDWNEAHVMELRTRRRLPDRLQWLKFTSIAWHPDGSGFFYGRYPEPSTSGTVRLRQANYDNKVYFHRLGDPQSRDRVVFERRDDRELSFGPSVTDDGRFLILNVGRGTDPKDGLYFAPLGRGVPAPPAFTRLFEQGGADFRFIGNEGRTFYLLTTESAPRRRVIAVDLDAPQPSKWRVVIPQGRDAVEQVTLIRGQLLVVTLRDAANAVSRFDTTGRLLGEIVLPGIGSVDGLAARQDDPDAFFGFTSFTHPRSVFRFDAQSGSVEPFWKPSVRFRAEDYVTTQVFVASKDGTRIPMFLTHRRDVNPDGSNPALLYGYGGFAASLSPFFNPSLVPWLESGGVYAVANLRGGGEYGEDWHQAGMQERRQNVFDDFIACARWLKKSGWAAPERLAIEGGSNGGLLVGAAFTQQPDLFRVVLCHVGVLDMLRYHKFTIGWAWVPEYGSAENAAQFQTLLSYSPLHRVRDGVPYPAVLLTTADHDDRVVPAHTYKMTAALQRAQAAPLPILSRIGVRAGHGAGKPIAQRVRDRAEQMAFLFRELGVQPRPAKP
jgi:prolyl oligopeptidase